MALDPKKLAAFAKEEVAEGHDEDEMEALVEGAEADEDEEEEEVDDAILVEQAIAEMEETGGDEEIILVVADYDPELDGNPPTWVEEEDLWERAKTAVDPENSPLENVWAVVATVYKKMGGSFKSE